MRGSDTSGRFALDDELRSVYQGIKADAQAPEGQFVDWFPFDTSSSTKDNLYDVSPSTTGGRRWKTPYRIPVVRASITQGDFYGDQRGFYVSDNMTLTINADEIYRTMPDLFVSVDDHFKDRFIYRSEVFTVGRVWPKGHLQGLFTTVTVEAVQVKPDELINDPQFLTVAQGLSAVQTAKESVKQGYPQSPTPSQTEYLR